MNFSISSLGLRFVTVLDATSKLFVWFANKDSFCMEDNFSEAVVVSIDEEIDKACFHCALESMRKHGGLLKKAEMKGKTYWFLIRPLQSIEQTVTIGFDTVNMICAVLEDLSKNLETDICFDATNISESNLQDLLMGTMQLFEKKGLT